MFGFGQKRTTQTSPPMTVLDLSGPKLRAAFEHLAKAAEQTGGIERYVSALALKSSLFVEIFARDKLAEMKSQEFAELASFISPVRRRMGTDINAGNFAHLLTAIKMLLDGWSDVSTTDARLDAFIGAFPADKEHRWVRDLGAEILHYSAPDHYPLMTRWMWDKRVGSGVLREIWFTDRVDAEDIDVKDDFATFVALAGEIEGFLSENGVYRDHAFYTDLLCAHIYAGYINDMGGQYLRADFTDTPDPMLHTRRMLGLDAINTATGRTRLKLIDGSMHTPGNKPTLLN